MHRNGQGHSNIWLWMLVIMYWSKVSCCNNIGSDSVLCSPISEAPILSSARCCPSGNQIKGPPLQTRSQGVYCNQISWRRLTVAKSPKISTVAASIFVVISLLCNLITSPLKQAKLILGLAIAVAIGYVLFSCMYVLDLQGGGHLVHAITLLLLASFAVTFTTGPTRVAPKATSTGICWPALFIMAPIMAASSYYT